MYKIHILYRSGNCIRKRLKSQCLLDTSAWSFSRCLILKYCPKLNSLFRPTNFLFLYSFSQLMVLPSTQRPKPEICESSQHLPLPHLATPDSIKFNYLVFFEFDLLFSILTTTVFILASTISYSNYGSCLQTGLIVAMLLSYQSPIQWPRC